MGTIHEHEVTIA